MRFSNSEIDEKYFDEFQTESFVSSSGVKFNFATPKNQKSGDPILLIHGLSNNWVGWIPVARILKMDYPVIMLDLPGYGDSSRLDCAYSVKDEARLVREFISEHGIKPISIVGLSAGSAIISSIIKSYQDEYRSFVLISPPISVFSEHKAFEKIVDIGSERLSKNEFLRSCFKIVKSTKTFSRAVAKKINCYQYKDHYLDFGLIGIRKMDSRAYHELGNDVRETDVAKNIALSKKPTLIIMGEHDKMCSPELALERIGNLPENIRFSIIPEAGHIVSVEKPYEVSSEILKFLKMFSVI